MILSKILHSLYLKIYISIIVSNSKTDVCVHILKSKSVKDSYMQTFKGSEVTQEMISYIQSFTGETPFYYISLLDYSVSQGAMPSCNDKEFSKYSDLETSQVICHDSWSSFTSKVDLINFDKKYSAFGLDFVFSPYTILKNFFKDKINSQATLFVLVQEDSLIVTVFEDSMLKYSEFVNMKIDKLDESLSIIDNEKENDDLDFDLDDLNAVNLEEIDVDDDLEDLDDLADIEDLDSIDDLEDFTEVKIAAPKPSAIKGYKEDMSGLGFNEDYKRFSAIQSALNQFYNDRKYESKFIESVYIAAACDVENDLKNYLEEELFLKVYVRQLNICEEMLDLVRREKI